jgi:hypothetical protein
MRLGRGVNQLTGEVYTSPAVTGTTAVNPVAAGQKISRKMMRLESSEQLRKTLDVDVSVEGRYGAFSGAARTRFADEVAQNRWSIYFLLTIRVTDADEGLDGPKLHEEAEGLLKLNKPERFRQRFGDEFIAGFIKGGDYRVVWSISGADETEKQAVAVDVQAGFDAVISSAEVGVRVNSKVERSRSFLKVDAHVYQAGGGRTWHENNIGEVLEKAEDFAAQVAGSNAIPYYAITRPYTDLRLPSDDVSFVELENARQALEEMWRARTALVALRSDLQYVLLSRAQNRGEFEAEPDDATVQGSYERVSDQIDKLTAAADRACRDAKKVEWETMDVSGIRLPKRLLPGPAPIDDLVTVPNAIGLEYWTENVGPGYLSDQFNVKWEVRGYKDLRAGAQGEIYEQSLPAGIRVPRGSELILTTYSEYEEPPWVR